MCVPQKLILPNEILLEEVANLLKEGKSAVICARGNSMSPFIRHEIDSVELVHADHVAVNDIALARVRNASGCRYVMHRVISLTDTGFIMMGDGNLEQKETVLNEDLIGIVKYIIRPDGRKVDVHAPGQLCCAKLWRILIPFRRVLLAVWRRIFN